MLCGTLSCNIQCVFDEKRNGKGTEGNFLNTKTDVPRLRDFCLCNLIFEIEGCLWPQTVSTDQVAFIGFTDLLEDKVSPCKIIKEIRREKGISVV